MDVKQAEPIDGDSGADLAALSGIGGVCDRMRTRHREYHQARRRTSRQRGAG
jgi:hypothetical protein